MFLFFVQKRNHLWVVLGILIGLASCGFHKPPVKSLPAVNKVDKKTLFIAFDGIAYSMMERLQKRGYFKDFETVPLVVPFPSATTIGFTGIFKPLNAGRVPGYETRFYSFKDNKIIGGTPKDIYKIPINYKYYFDSFRHTMVEKSVMYTFPGVAGQQDLLRTRELLFSSSKRVLFTYLGGTDGAQHLLGRVRSERFMIFVDRFLKQMKADYAKQFNEPLRIVLFSDHGFHFDNMKMVWTDDLQKEMNYEGLKVTTRLEDKKDVVFVRYGLLSAGVGFTHPQNLERLARRIVHAEGMDLVFWSQGNKIHILGANQTEAYFDYRWPHTYRYVEVHGDPLGYGKILKKKGKSGAWLSSREWFDLTWNTDYPDAGYRLYESFHTLVKNEANIMFSLKKPYQFGSLAAYAGTKLKPGGHKGTHGGLFKEVSWGMAMTDDPNFKMPQAIRYDDFLKIFLPPVTQAYSREHGKKEIQVLVQPHSHQ